VERANSDDGEREREKDSPIRENLSIVYPVPCKTFVLGNERMNERTRERGKEREGTTAV
jgi:hypothetical protein